MPVARRGLSLVEVLVALGIIAVLGLLSYPVYTERMNVNHAAAVVSELEAFETAIKRFRTDVGRYPRKLTYLNILFDSTGVVDACNTAISAINQGRYRGPYINRQIDPVKPYPPSQNTRFTTATDDSIESVITRTTIATTGGTQQVLEILVIGPNSSITRMIDSTVDGVVNNADGIVRYAAIQPTQNRIRWTMAIPNGAC